MSEHQIPKKQIWPIIESAWISISNCCDRNKFKVTLEINGKEHENYFYSYPSQDEGVVSQLHNLSSIIENSKQVKDLQSQLEEMNQNCISLNLHESRMKAVSEELEACKKENESLGVKLNRTVSAAYHGMLELTAYMGIPQSKRENIIKEQMSNVEYCAANDLRRHDLDQVNQKLAEAMNALKKVSELEAEIQRLRAKYESKYLGRP